jgi:hypothetical protein
MIDLARVDASLVHFRPAKMVLSEASQLTDYLSSQAGEFRIYSPSYSLPQQVAANAGVELAGGVNPLQLAGYADFFSKASGVLPTGYSVTLPPYANGMPENANLLYTPDPTQLGLLNVRFLTAEFNINNIEAFELKQVYGETRIYENSLYRPRAWIQAQDGENRAAEILSRTPNRIVVQAQGSGELVLSEVMYPGWRSWVDGVQTDIRTYEGILRSVHLSGEGIHRIDFKFRPVSLYLGLTLCGLAALFCLVYSLRSRQR